MSQHAITFVTLGGTFLLALGAQELGRRTRLPRVTMLLLLGFVVGPEGFALLPESVSGLFEAASEIALTIVGFLLGERLVYSLRSGQGRSVIWISLTVVFATTVIVSAGALLFGVGIGTALLLAGVATATDPAATIDVVRQTGSKGKFTDTLLGVVAVDDAWGLLAFSFLLACAKIVVGESAGIFEPLREGGLELLGSVVLGLLLGLVLGWLNNRLRTAESALVESFGFVFLACGLALWMEVSFILASMVMGAVVALVARDEKQPFHMIEDVERPFMILFFTLAGASLDLDALVAIGWIGVGFVLLRVVGRIVGGWLGARFAGCEAAFGRGIGTAMMPQAGVALGMALIARKEFPEIGEVVMQVAIGSTVFFELVGPLVTGRMLKHHEGEVETSGSDTSDDTTGNGSG